MQQGEFVSNKVELALLLTKAQDNSLILFRNSEDWF